LKEADLAARRNLGSSASGGGINDTNNTAIMMINI
jgi:hypothetical protein